MERMRLLSSIFRSKKSLSKGVEQLEAGNSKRFQGEEDYSETFMRFQEEEEEDIGIPPSREDQYLGSPIEDGTFPIF